VNIIHVSFHQVLRFPAVIPAHAGIYPWHSCDAGIPTCAMAAFMGLTLIADGACGGTGILRVQHRNR